MLTKILSRLLHIYFLFSRPKTLGARCVIINLKNEILLIQHTYILGWYLPGGGVEKGESIVSTVVREVREEAGIELLVTPRLHGIFFNSEVSKRDHVAVYVANKYKMIRNHAGSAEISDVAFFDPNHLPEDIDRGTATRIVEVTKNQPQSETW